MNEHETVVLTIRLEKSDMERMERMAKKVGVRRGPFARNLLLAGLEDAQFLDAIGLFTLARKIEQWREKGFEDSREMQTA